MARDIIEDILTILVIISFLVAIIMLLWRIFGDSPTILDLITTVLSGLLFYVFKTEYSRGKFEGKVKTSIHYTKEGFRLVREDISNLRTEVKEEIKNLRGELNENINSLKNQIKSGKK